MTLRSANLIPHMKIPGFVMAAASIVLFIHFLPGLVFRTPYFSGQHFAILDSASDTPAMSKFLIGSIKRSTLTVRGVNHAVYLYQELVRAVSQE